MDFTIALGNASNETGGLQFAGGRGTLFYERSAGERILCGSAVYRRGAFAVELWIAAGRAVLACACNHGGGNILRLNRGKEEAHAGVTGKPDGGAADA